MPHWHCRMLRPLLAFMMDHIDKDLRAQEALIFAEGDWLDYTIFEPPQLTPTAPTGKAVVAVEKPPPGTNQVGIHNITWPPLHVNALARMHMHHGMMLH